MSNTWLISHDYQDRIRTAVAAGKWPTAEQQKAYREEAAKRRAASGKPENYRVEGSTAHISIAGLLTPEPDFWAEIFGEPNTTYSDIAESVRLAENDPNVKETVYDVNSGGGLVDGITGALDAIDSSQKPSRVQADYAASAGYWLATRAAVGGKLSATGPLASFGSIGVAVSAFLDPRLKQIASTDAPNKRPDPSTDEGVAAIRKELDAIHDQFANDVADARGVTRETVNSQFGMGGMLLAEAALAVGMIDDFEPRKSAAHKIKSGGNSQLFINDGNTVAQPPPGASNKEPKTMDISTLKSQHPDVYAAVRNEGIEAAVKEERARVSAHLTWAEASGEQKFAMTCIAEGKALSVDVLAHYQTAAFKKVQLSNREADDAQVAAAVNGAPTAVPVVPAGAKKEETAEERDKRIAAELDKFGK